MPKRLHAGVAPVIDASLTMTANTRAGRPKIEAAKEAARLFIDQMVFPEDQAAIVSFNERAYVHQALTGEADAVLAALERIENYESTGIDLRVAAGHAELRGPNRVADNTPSLVLLTDGKSNPVPASEAIAAASAATRDGASVFIVGRGSDVEPDALRTMTSKPEY